MNRTITALAATAAALVAGLAFAGSASAAPLTHAGPAALDTPFHLANNTGYTLHLTKIVGGNPNPNQPATKTIKPGQDAWISDDIFHLGQNNVVTADYQVEGTPYTLIVETDPGYGAGYGPASRVQILDQHGAPVNPSTFNAVGDGSQITVGTPVTWTLNPAYPIHDYQFEVSTGLSGDLRDQGGLTGWYDGTSSDGGPVTLTTVKGVNPHLALQAENSLAGDTLTLHAHSFSDTGNWVSGDGGTHALTVTVPQANIG